MKPLLRAPLISLVEVKARPKRLKLLRLHLLLRCFLEYRVHQCTSTNVRLYLVEPTPQLSLTSIVSSFCTVFCPNRLRRWTILNEVVCASSDCRLAFVSCFRKFFFQGHHRRGASQARSYRHFSSSLKVVLSCSLRSNLRRFGIRH